MGNSKKKEETKPEEQPVKQTDQPTKADEPKNAGEIELFIRSPRSPKPTEHVFSSDTELYDVREEGMEEHGFPEDTPVAVSVNGKRVELDSDFDETLEDLGIKSGDTIFIA